MRKAYSVVQFERWLDNAEPGDTHVYFTGVLSRFRNGYIKPEIAKAAWEAEQEKKVLLYQQPVDSVTPRSFVYVAQKRSKPGDDPVKTNPR